MFDTMIYRRYWFLDQ